MLPGYGIPSRDGSRSRDGHGFGMACQLPRTPDNTRYHGGSIVMRCSLAVQLKPNLYSGREDLEENSYKWSKYKGPVKHSTAKQISSSRQTGTLHATCLNSPRKVQDSFRCC